MEDLSTIFGGEALTLEQFTAKCDENKIKLANLTTGKYVDSEKYSKLKSDFESYKTEAEGWKKPDYDDIINENKTLKAKIEENDRLKAVAGANIDEKFAKFVCSEVNAMVNDKKDFETALKEYAKENPQYQKATGFRTVASGLPLNGENTEQGQNVKMNNFLRGVK